MEDFTINKKHKALLDTSRELFWKYGFRRVTIDEICREAKTSKMTFYRFFPNKLELARTVLDQFYDENLKSLREFHQLDSSPSDKMKRILEMKLEWTNDISNEFLQDFYINPELGLSQYIEEKTGIILTEIIKFFQIGQDEGWIRKDIKVEFLLFLIQKTSGMISDRELLKLYNSTQDLIMELTNLFVYGISPTK